MPGGLVQLVVYGSQDLFLTGSPQITFFKAVYRRYTNFAIESIRQNFINGAKFGSEMSCVIEKVGDLMSRVYLEIELPKINLVKNRCQNYNIDSVGLKNTFDKIQSYYDIFYNYISVNTDIARKLQVLIRTNNISFSEIEYTMTNTNFIGKLVTAREALQSYISTNSNFDMFYDQFPNITRFDLVQEINSIDVQLLFLSSIKTISCSNIDENSDLIKRNIIACLLKKNLYCRMKDVYMQVYHVYKAKYDTYQLLLNRAYVERYKFAWVEEVGHAVIDQIDIKIGNQLIDRHTGDWLSLFSKISVSEYQLENYNRMIGNVRELVVFDDRVKNVYRLIIPFQFWFCRYTGLAIPLIALKYHDVMITVRLKDLASVCYVEECDDLFNLSNIQSQYDINICNASLYVDYVLLDTDERKRFAQSTHEYLIETVQYQEFDGEIGDSFHAHLDFSHPTKYAIWFVQPIFYRENPSGYNKCQWNNYGTCLDKTGYSLDSTYLNLNTINRTDKQLDVVYYNYLQPYCSFKHSPTDGFNLYSFAINPLQFQPTGSINFSRINDFEVVVRFSKNFINLVQNTCIDNIFKGFFMGVYVQSYNILRIISGMGGLAFQNGT